MTLLQDSTLTERAQRATADATEQATERATAVWERIADFETWVNVIGTSIQVLIIFGLALLILGVVKRLLRRWTRRVEALPAIDPRRQRAFTLSNLLRSAARYLVWFVATIMILAQVGINIGPLLAGAGVAGLAIGFGAQTFVKDVISGIFLLFDNTIHVGDLVTFGSTTGTVENIGLRLIQVRKFDGELVMIPAGELRTFGNKSVGFARAIVPVGISYEQDLDEVLGALNDVAQEWAAIPENQQVMLEPAPTVQAVIAFGDSAVTARIVVQVTPGAQFAAERDMMRMIKRHFDERGVEIPFPRQTVYIRQEPDFPVGSIVPGAPPGDEPAA